MNDSAADDKHGIRFCKHTVSFIAMHHQVGRTSPPVASSPNLTNYPNYRRGRIGHGRRQDERVLAVETSPLSSSGLAHRLDKGRIDPRCRLGFRPRSTRPEVTPGLFPGAVHSGSTPTVRGDSGSQETHSVVFSQTPSAGYGARTVG